MKLVSGHSEGKKVLLTRESFAERSPTYTALDKRYMCSEG